MAKQAVVGLIVAGVTAVALWVSPLLLFPTPGANDAIVLADLTLPVVGAILAGSIAVVIVGVTRGWRSSGAVALGVFFIGVAAVFVISLLTIGNMSNDRFMPLLFLPVPFAAVGLAALAIGLSQRTAGALGSGFVVGGIATALLLAWCWQEALGTGCSRLTASTCCSSWRSSRRPHIGSARHARSVQLAREAIRSAEAECRNVAS